MASTADFGLHAAFCDKWREKNKAHNVCSACLQTSQGMFPG